MHIAAISGSPTQRSRSTWLLHLANARLEARPPHTHFIHLRELPAAALMAADHEVESIRGAIHQVQRAQLVLVATPIYKALYSGLLKLFDALRGKTVLPLATAGSPAHLLALDYALKPVLSALGARDILDGVYASDTQLVPDGAGGYVPDAALVRRLDRALAPLADRPDRAGRVHVPPVPCSA
jgi:FMN reductase